jgi:hypothetical protein
MMVVLGPSEDSFVGAPPKYRLVCTPSTGKSQVPPPSLASGITTHLSSRCYHRHLSRLSSSKCYPQAPVKSPQPISHQAPQQKTAVVNTPCFNCGRVGHYAQQCRKPEKGKAPRVPASMVIQPIGQLMAPTPISGRVNHTTVEDIPEGEEVLTGTFLLFV